MHKVKVVIHTDGSCNNKTGIGGYGYVIRIPKYNKIKKVSVGHFTNTTSNRMELIAVLKAIQWTKKKGYSNIYLYSDSQYVVKGCNEWSRAWIRRKWSNVKNKDIWKELVDVKNNVNISWVRGHNNDKYNEMADELAGQGSSNAVAK